MQKNIIYLSLLLLLTGCFSGSPTEDDIREAFEHKLTQNLSPSTLWENLAEFKSLGISHRCKEVETEIDTWRCYVTFLEESSGKKEDVPIKIQKNSSGSWILI